MSEELFGRIAIIGMSGRFPGAPDLDTFWVNLSKGLESIRTYDDGELIKAGIHPDLLNEPQFVKAGAELEDAMAFDASFFGFAPSEAMLMDPQFRVFLESAWHALEDAGYDPWQSEERIGVFASMSMATYIHRLLEQTGVDKPESTLRARIYNDKDFLATLTSYKLNLRGPSFNVQTACSSSLVAVHLAIGSLLSGECELALAGGVAVSANQRTGYMFYEGGINSPDGHCRPFDAVAGGTVLGNGVGLVVLKKLEGALADGDHLEAVILGTALNNDGASKMNFTAPSISGQVEVIAEALLVADVDADTIGMVETHGTGTALGDSTEIEALATVYQSQTDRRSYCGIGSVKSNIGHLDAAAGVAGLIKCALSLKQGQMPPMAVFQSPNPRIDFESTPFFVLDSLKAWPESGTPRRAALSSFGVGGTNVHAIVEEAPTVEPGDPSEQPQLLVLSAQNPKSLELMSQNLADFLVKNPGVNLADVAYTLQVGRRALPIRRNVFAKTAADAAQSLGSTGAGMRAQQTPGIVFMFPGQGAQYLSMARDLMNQEGVFRDTVNTCFQYLREQFQLELAPLVFAASPDEEATARLNQTHNTQPALFVISYAMAKYWQSLGVVPEAMIGMSIGEYVAATLAGVFTLEDALRLITMRGRLISKLPAGSMLAVGMDINSLRRRLPEALDITGVNSGSDCVVGGPSDAVAAFEKQLVAEDVKVRNLHTSHAFHSRLMEPILEAFSNEVAGITFNEPTLPFISNVTGSWISKIEATDPKYWVRHLRSTVQWHVGMTTLLEGRSRIFLEVGPGSTLGALLRRQPNQDQRTLFYSLPNPKGTTSSSDLILQTLGKLWCEGVTVSWPALHVNHRRLRLALPTYPFQKTVYEPAVQAATKILQKSEDISEWLYLPTWQQSPLTAAAQPGKQRILILGGEHPLLDELESQLGSAFSQRVRTGETFSSEAEGYRMDPRQEAHYEGLLAHLSKTNTMPTHVVHAWGLGSTAADTLTTHEANGFYSLLFFSKALRKHAPREHIYLARVTDLMQMVSGEETTVPQKASVLGPIKVIPKEHPQCHTASLDLFLEASDAKRLPSLATAILHELRAQLPDRLVALRGRLRWTQDYKRQPLAVGPVPVRKNGTYLITGGLGGVGLTLAESLAEQQPVNLVLTGRTAMPDRAIWPEMVESFKENPVTISESASHVTLHLPGALALLDQMEQHLLNLLVIPELPKKRQMEQELNQLCTAWILDYFRKGGVDLSPGRIYIIETLQEQLRILPKFEKFLAMFIKALDADGFATLEGDRLRFTDKVARANEPRDLSAQMRRSFPEFAAVFGLLEHCTAHYLEALSGGIEAIGVLYPEGKGDLLLQTAKDTSAFSKDNLYQQLLRDFMLQLIATKKGGPLRILEVGAGNGNLTKVLNDVLDEQKAHYVFTDLGKSFVLKGEREAKSEGQSFMEFHVFDITKDPELQGLHKHGYDLVVGFDVVHATRDIAESTENIRALLAPKGLMCLVESVRTSRWVDMVWGLAEGWWMFEDYHLRTDSPLMPPHIWEKALAPNFADVVCYPRDESARANSDFTLVLAQQHAVIEDEGFLAPRLIAARIQWETNRHRIQEIQKIEAMGSKVLTLVGDISNEASMQSVVALAVSSFGAVNGVINASGILEDRPIQLKTQASAARVLAPKVKGTLVLEEALAGQPLDFTLLCSSLAALQGNFTQVDHCAANCFLDAYAHAEPSNGRRISINWGTWRDVGLAKTMASDKLEGLKQERERFGITPAEAKKVFTSILGTGLNQVVVSTTDLHTSLNTEFELNVAEMPAFAAARGLHERPDLAIPYEPPNHPLDSLLTQMWGALLGIENVGINDNFFDLGADSLMGITLVNQLQAKLGEIVHITALLDAPTVALLANYLREHYPLAVARITGDAQAEDQRSGIERVTPEMVDTFKALIYPGRPIYELSPKPLKQAIFILSAPRSGSTLLRVMLGGHPHLFAPPEMDLIPFANLAQRRDALVQDASMLEGATEALMQARGITAEEAEQQMAAFEDESLSVYHFYDRIQSWIEHKVLVEKSPSYALNPDSLARIESDFENPLFIHLVRHPYGMIHSYENARLDLLFSAEMRAKSPFNRRQLAELTWTLSERHIRDFFQTLPAKRTLQIRYEDLVDQPRLEMERISAFIGQPFHESMLEPYQEKHKRMTSGLHESSRMLGDVKFHEHKDISSAAAGHWKNAYKADFLGEVAMAMAKETGFELIGEDAVQKVTVTEAEDPETMIANLSGESLDRALAEMMKGQT